MNMGDSSAYGDAHPSTILCLNPCIEIKNRYLALPSTSVRTMIRETDRNWQQSSMGTDRTCHVHSVGSII